MGCHAASSRAESASRLLLSKGRAGEASESLGPTVSKQVRGTWRDENMCEAPVLHFSEGRRRSLSAVQRKGATDQPGTGEPSWRTAACPLTSTHPEEGSAIPVAPRSRTCWHDTVGTRQRGTRGPTGAAPGAPRGLRSTWPQRAVAARLRRLLASGEKGLFPSVCLHEGKLQILSNLENQSRSKSTPSVMAPGMPVLTELRRLAGGTGKACGSSLWPEEGEGRSAQHERSRRGFQSDFL